MDPLTQAAFGAALSTALPLSQKKKWLSFSAGAIGGMAPDLDVLIRSSSDTLLALEYHRGFTHSLLFVPIGAFIVALFLKLTLFQKEKLKFIYLFSALGFLTHGFLDACTSYGTRLYWPFLQDRVAWDLISIIDPIFTLILITGLVFFLVRRSFRFSLGALILAFCYLGFNASQKYSAREIQTALMQQRKHMDVRMRNVKPSIFNSILWRSTYVYDNEVYADGIWTFPFMKSKIYEGKSTALFVKERDLPNLAETSQVYKDIQRFSFFSAGYIGVVSKDPFIIGDLRYSFLPNELKPLWGIVLSPDEPNEHAVFLGMREVTPQIREDFKNMLLP